MKSIFDRDIWQEIFGSISQNKLRTLITIIGVLWGIFLYILLSGIAKGVDNGFEERFERISSNSLFVWTQNTSIPYGGFKIDRSWNIKLKDVESLKKEIPEIQYIAPRIQKGNFGSQGANVINGNRSGTYNIYGDFPILKVVSQKDIYDGGRFINELDIKQQRKVCVIGERTQKELFNDDVVIQIYSKSLHKKLGEGSGEIIKKEYKVLPNVIKLFKINDWRKKLDNSWIFNKDNEKLEIKGNLWPSIDHYMYAIRFNNLSDIYNKFTINNDETKTLELAKIFYEKMVKNYKKNIISESDYNKIYSEYLTIALTAKFTIQKNESYIYNEEYNNILLLTKDYKINIYKPGKYGGPYEAIELMKIRKLLAK